MPAILAEKTPPEVYYRNQTARAAHTRASVYTGVRTERAADLRAPTSRS